MTEKIVFQTKTFCYCSIYSIELQNNHNVPKFKCIKLIKKLFLGSILFITAHANGYTVSRWVIALDNFMVLLQPLAFNFRNSISYCWIFAGLFGFRPKLKAKGDS